MRSTPLAFHLAARFVRSCIVLSSAGLAGFLPLIGQETGGTAPSSVEAAPNAPVLLSGDAELSAWTALETQDPRKFAALDAAEQQRLIDEGQIAKQKFWRWENGEIINDGEGPYLTTLKSYRDFELTLEYATVAEADSGIYLKATPQVQIWDTTEAGSKWNIGAGKGSGGLWNNSEGAPGKDPLSLADKPFGEWNSVGIVQVGARTSVWLNGQLVVDKAIMENYWDRNLPLAATGPIQLQTHGGQIRWKNVKVRELGSDEAGQWLAARSGNGFAGIFNGTSLDGWRGPVDNYEVADGAIRCKPGHGGTIYTADEYANFTARQEFRLPPGGNNGLAIRYPGEGDAAYSGMCELQVLDSEDPQYAGLDARQYHGSVYGVIAAHRGYLRPAGEWNFQEVTVNGSRIRVELNGSVILDGDVAAVTEYLGDNPHPGKDRTSGHFGLAGHGDAVEFRRVDIRDDDRPVETAEMPAEGPGEIQHSPSDVPLAQVAPPGQPLAGVPLPPDSGYYAPVAAAVPLTGCCPPPPAGCCLQEIRCRQGGVRLMRRPWLLCR